MQKRNQDNRPKNLNLLTIRLPINAVISILHRVSGIGLFLLLPVMLLAFQQSLGSEVSYLALIHRLHNPLLKCLFIACSFMFFHHFYAGIRHLLQDIHWMTSLQKARFSSRFVLWLDGISVMLFAWVIW